MIGPFVHKWPHIEGTSAPQYRKTVAEATETLHAQIESALDDRAYLITIADPQLRIVDGTGWWYMDATVALVDPKQAGIGEATIGLPEGAYQLWSDAPNIWAWFDGQHTRTFGQIGNVWVRHTNYEDIETRCAGQGDPVA